MYGYIDGYLFYLQAEKNASLHTVQNYQRDLFDGLSFFARTLNRDDHTLHPAEITVALFRQYLGDMRTQNKAGATILRRLSSWRSFYRYICREGVLSENPLRRLGSPRREKKLPGFLAEEEVNRLMEVPDRVSILGARDRAVLEMLYGTGIRVGELVGIDIGAVDFKRAAVKVTGKGNRERIAPLGEYAAKALNTYIKRARPVLMANRTGRVDALFLNHRGERLSDRGVRWLIKRYAARAGLEPGTSPHTFRHSYATHMLDHGADLRVVQELLGHARLSTTQIYTHLSREHIKRVYEQTHPRR